MKQDDIVLERIHAALTKVIDQQIASNDPKETKILFQFLIELGRSKHQAYEIISKVISIEMIDLAEKGEMNMDRYVKNLNQLLKIHNHSKS